MEIILTMAVIAGFALAVFGVVLLVTSRRHNRAYRLPQTGQQRPAPRVHRISVEAVATQLGSLEVCVRDLIDHQNSLRREFDALSVLVHKLDQRPAERPTFGGVDGGATPPRGTRVAGGGVNQGRDFGLKRASTLSEPPEAGPRLSPEEQAAKLVERSCTLTIRLQDVLREAKRLHLVWGAVDLNQIPATFEPEREADVMAIGASDAAELFVVVGENCVYSDLRLSRFFGQIVTDRNDQRVFATTPALAILRQGRTIEARRPGVLVPSS